MTIRPPDPVRLSPKQGAAKWCLVEAVAGLMKPDAYDHPNIVYLFPLISPTLESLLVITDQPDTNSDRDVYDQRMRPSTESFSGGHSSAPNLSDFGASRIPLAVNPTPHGEPNAISRFPWRRWKTS